MTAKVVNIFYIAFTGLVWLVLYPFFFNSLIQHYFKNRTTNEKLRQRWNGDPDNQYGVKIYNKKTNCCSKLNYLCC
jgi:hypothetical protein